MSYCVVFGCPERSPKSDKRFHIFPNPDKFPKRHKLWVLFCGNDHFKLGKTSTICSGHFKKSDYDPSQLLRQKLMGTEFCKPRLKPESVPSIIPADCAKHQTKYSRAKRRQVEIEGGEKIIYMSSEKSAATCQSQESEHVDRDVGPFSTVFMNSDEKMFAERENAANLHTLGSVACLEAESEVQEDPLGGAGTTTHKFSQCREDHILGSAVVVKMESEIKSVGIMNGVGSTMYNFPHHTEGTPNDIVNTTNSFQYADDTPNSAAVSKLASEVKSEDIMNGVGNVTHNFPLCTDSTSNDACNTTRNSPRRAEELIKVERDDDSATIQSPAECKSFNVDCSFAVQSNVIIKKEEDLGAEEDAAETLVDDYSVANEEDFERDDGAAVVQSSVEYTSSYASSFVSESNLIVKKEQDLGIVDEVADKLVDDYFHVSVDEEDLDSDKSSQTATASNEADESIRLGVYQEGCGESKEVHRSRLCSTTNDKPHSCASCPAKFKKKHDLNRHLLTHTDLGLYSCPSCPSKFKAKCWFKWHLLTHTNDRLYPCASCPAKFRAKHQLARHLLTHTVDRVFSCFSCPLKFRTKSLLARHLITHTNNKPYASTYCPAKFKRKGTLKDHLKTHVAKKPSNADIRVEKPFSCTLCASKFRYNDSLIEHLRIHTENPHLFANTAPLNLKLPPV